MDKDTIEYVPVEHSNEGPKTFTINVTIDPEGQARVEVAERGDPPRRVQSRVC